VSKDTLYLPGQLYLSATEPELGIGVIISADRRFVEIAFSRSDCCRKYGISSAPFQRVVFKIGDIIKDSNGREHRITSVNDEDSSGKILYRCAGEEIREDLVVESCTSITPPLRRLLNKISDRCEEFELRLKLLWLKETILKSPVRGFVGARMKLLPHQLFIASEVSSRRRVRVLLADETGLGKTIEACLIMHRMILTGRMQRCLICVPESLTHQWFIELLRRFNLMFTLFSKEHFDSCDRDGNPFCKNQFGIISIQMLAKDDVLRDLAVSADWDMIVVDEAHHLRFGTREYDTIRRLSEKSMGIILLSATPEQYGLKDHFLRLQLLDPVRYADFNEFKEEMKDINELSQWIHATLVEKNIDLNKASPDTVLLNIPDNITIHDNGYGISSHFKDKKMTLSRIIDCFGTGRVMFRNTRKIVSGFPKRFVHIEPLSGDDALRKSVNEEYNKLIGDEKAIFPLLCKDDPRILWLVKLLRINNSAQFLVICSTKEKAKAIQEALQAHINLKIALFHEDMTLVQRDRNAAWFMEENGARVLICSEIGSEGRNFQCCRHLVLFDLPLEPEVLEQRIGRLDRIGQGPCINIYVPYVVGTFQEILCRWYHEGLAAFENNVPAAGSVWEAVRETIVSLATSGFPAPERLLALVSQSAELCMKFSREYIDNRDHLLEISSFQPAAARHLIETIIKMHDQGLPIIMNLLFKHYGILSEESGPDKWRLITDYVTDARFPLTRQENPVVTYERETALSREDVEFISMDHPMIGNALDLFLSSDQGTSVVAVWDDAGEKEFLLESIFVLECVAPSNFYAGRFLSPTPIRVIVNEKAEDVTDHYSTELLERMLKNALPDALFANFTNNDAANEIITMLQDKADAVARQFAGSKIEQSIRTMKNVMNEEIDRLIYLRRMNHSVSDMEIEQCTQEKEALEKYLKSSQVRLDSIRVVLRRRR
jgi:ATP-dependent helicase HepA